MKQIIYFKRVSPAWTEVECLHLDDSTLIKELTKIGFSKHFDNPCDKLCYNIHHRGNKQFAQMDIAIKLMSIGFKFDTIDDKKNCKSLESCIMTRDFSTFNFDSVSGLTLNVYS